ncbi:MAG: endolytic transglycosylase MltG [Gammaproteobacteria bacterium]|nr:endolytic transglycosylase MltG [Gammaproteobacteria bacterium]MDH5799378.1 endolytic transglycosylase MltG [Gammaproteobacteria bacterium]
MKNVVYKLVGAGVLIGSLAGGWVYMAFDRFLNTPMQTLAEGQAVEIKSGQTLTHFSKNLFEQKIIDHPRYLVWYGRVMGKADKIKVGEYFINRDMTPKTLFDKITRGQTIQYSATFVEGWTFRELMTELQKNPNLKHTLTDLSAKHVMASLGLEGTHPEGWFLPDTYNFPRGTTDVEYLQRAYKAMKQYLETEWEKRAAGLPYKTSYEALIMASIVEKETGLASERPTIAGVFVRRLQKGMRLQTDPTVIYGIGEKFDGNIRRRDLLKDTPYNTYRRHGLPPTPIAMPGREAIYAALHPEDGNSLYFVAKGDGSHVFTGNLRDHNNAVIKYQLGGKARPFSSMPKVPKKVSQSK